MKVFEVRWESLGDDDIITETIEYATHEDDCLMGVVQHYEFECVATGVQLKGVREVLVVCNQIESGEG